MRGHPTAILLLVVSYVVLANFAVDVLAATFPASKPVSGLKQAVTGA